MTYLVHILAGGLGLRLGFVALAATKGAALHRKSGMLFLYVMLTTSVAGMIMAAVRNVAPAVNVPAALLPFYLVVTALITVRPPAGPGQSGHRERSRGLRQCEGAPVTRTTNARIAGFTFLFYIALGIPAMVLLGKATSSLW